MNLDPKLLDILVCPACRSALAVDEQASELVCSGCHRAYPVRDDIPVLLVDEARQPPAPTSQPAPPAADSGRPDSGGDSADTGADTGADEGADEGAGDAAGDAGPSANTERSSGDGPAGRPGRAGS